MANEKRNQLVTVCKRRSRDIDAHTSRLPRAPKTAKTDRPRTGQFSWLLFVEALSSVQLVGVDDMFEVAREKQTHRWFSISWKA